MYNDYKVCIFVMYIRNNNDRAVFYHFVGAVPLSTSLSDMLQRLLNDLCDVSGVKTCNISQNFTFSFASAT